MKFLGVTLLHGAETINRGGVPDYVSQSISIWRESSNKISEITKQKGIDYIHVLQPNQHFLGSKNFTDEELRIAFGSQTYAEPIRNYYKFLGREGLKTENFRDQRLMFKNVTETVYRDNCCHFNKMGMEYIVDDILEKYSHVFRRHLNQKPSQK